MVLTRKEFLKASSLMAGGLLIPGSKTLAGLLDDKGNFKLLRNNIGIYSEKGGTIGWLISYDGVIIIDSQFPDSARNMHETLKKKTARSIDRLFNTHHHGDHTGGNIYLKDHVSKIVAHENCPELQKKNYGNDPAKPQAYATVTFKEEFNETFGKEKINAKYFGPAHTGGDSVIHFQNANIAHVGDLVFNRTYPFIDSNGGGSVANWAKVLDSISKHYSKETLFIFGHGATDDLVTGTLDDVVGMKNYISALVDYVTSEIKKGKSREEVAASQEIPGFKDLKERWSGAKKMNLEKAYDELALNIQKK